MKYQWILICCLVKCAVCKYKQPNPEKYFMALHVAMIERNLIEYEDDNLTIIDDWNPKGKSKAGDHNLSEFKSGLQYRGKMKLEGREVAGPS